MLPMIQSAVDGFSRMFGRAPDLVAMAPGRVNLIGEHTDYNEGFVFPAAIDRYTVVAASRTNGPTVLYSGSEAHQSVFNTDELEPGRMKTWGKYPAGMAWAFQERGYPAENLNGFVTSNVPMSSGVSSSAALEMAFGVLWRAFHDLTFDNVELAKLGQRCENGFILLKSGIMDQLASANGRSGHAIFVDTKTLDLRHAPIPADLAILILDTKTPRTLASSEYNLRKADCDAVAEALAVPSLRHVTPDALETEKDRITDQQYRRARHVVTENERCLRFADALERGDYAEIGQLMLASHISLREDYDAVTPALDAMVDAAMTTEGVIGARMTGAGFGGACVALVRSERAADAATEINEKFCLRHGQLGDTMIAHAADGARLV